MNVTRSPQGFIPYEQKPFHGQYNAGHEVSSIPLVLRPKYGVLKASRKYNVYRSYIYRWRKRWDGTVQSLACRSRRPHHHPNAHTPEEIALILRYRRRNPSLSLIELWARLTKSGYTRRPESLYRVLRRLGKLPKQKKVKKYVPKPYEPMTHPGERVQIDVKVVPRKCIADPRVCFKKHKRKIHARRIRIQAR